MIDVKIIGIGGHSRSLASNFHGHKINIVGYFDDKGSKEEVLLQKINFLGFFDAIDWRSKIVIGIGDNIKRSFFYKKMKIAPPTLVHQTAVLNSSDINTGSQIFPNSFIGVNSLIGSNCIINTGAIIEHDTRISDNCHISVGAIICGNTKIGENCFIGTNAVIQHGIIIGKNVTVGSLAFVNKDCENDSVYIGIPAKKKK